MEGYVDTIEIDADPEVSAALERQADVILKEKERERESGRKIVELSPEC